MDEKLTVIGKCLSGLPVDITIGKMLLMGSIFGQVEAVLALAAALSVQTPFTNRAYRDSDCEAARKELDSDHGDPLTLLNAYRAWLEIKASNQSATSRKWCKKRGLEEQRFYEMTKLRQQFRHILADAGLLPAAENDSAAKQSSSAQRAVRHVRFFSLSIFEFIGKRSFLSVWNAVAGPSAALAIPQKGLHSIRPAETESP